MPLLGSIEKNMEVNPLLKYDTSVPAKYYTDTVESQEPIKSFWRFGTLGHREALKHRGTESTEEGARRRGRKDKRSVRKKKILRPFAARHGAAARLTRIKRATALAGTIRANA